MVKLLTCSQLPSGVAFNPGNTNSRNTVATATIHNSHFLVLPGMMSVEIAAADGEESAGFPLEEQDDGGEHDDLAHDGRAELLLQHLIGHADAERGINRADDAADA